MEERLIQRKAPKIWGIVAVFLITLVLNILCSIFVVFGYTIFYSIRDGISDINLITELMYQDISVITFASIYNLMGIGTVFLFWRYINKRNIRELGFGITKKTSSNILWGILAAVSAISLIIALGILFDFIFYNDTGIWVYGTPRLVYSLMMGIVAFLLVGFGEEAVYRSYIQNHIVDMAGKRLGLFLAALIFAAVHLLSYQYPLDLLDVFLAGIILGYAFILTKSIYLSASFHFMWDLLQINIVRLQDYEAYTGPVLLLFNNAGNLVIGGITLGNKIELVFILVEFMILLLMYCFRKKIEKLAE